MGIGDFNVVNARKQNGGFEIGVWKLKKMKK